MGIPKIQVPFNELRVIIDVDFWIIEERVPTLLSMRDMIHNGLDISIQHARIYPGKSSQKFAFENCFLIHRWDATKSMHIYYTENELRTIHRTMGHT